MGELLGHDASGGPVYAPEPTVQVPVSLIEHVSTFLDGMGMTPILAAELRATLSQPTPSAKAVTTEQAWDQGFEAGATWPQHTPSGIPVDPPTNPYESEHAVIATPPRIADMAPGTTFEYPERWEVGRTGIATGRRIAHSRDGNRAQYLDEFDPSTIRDVTSPPSGSEPTP